MSSPLTKPKSRAAHAFGIALAVALLLFLPFLIFDKGYFIYYGDFNVQQIPFYQMAHDAVHSGNFGWNWTTDLGANFIGSYSFYLLGSPFFWLTIPFPSEAVPYLMAPLLILKMALAALFAYGYLRRFVKPNMALFASLLYAFSGFSFYNIFFNHFHEAILYFPLMLLGMERLMTEKKRGLFALAVFLSAVSNYYFFIGQAIFLVVYWFLRALSGDWNVTFPKFLSALVEAVAGTAMAAILLAPSFFAVIQNTRVDSPLIGWNGLIYDTPQRFYDILHSFFFPADIPARANFFPDANNNWASMSAWLPVFGCTGLIAYMQSRSHRDWLKRLLTFCLLCAFTPLLNAMFQLFNSMYYARWYYMMVMMMVLATALCFDRTANTSVNWKRTFGWCGGITAVFALYIGLMPASLEPNTETGKITLGLMKYPERFWITVTVAVVALLLAGLMVLLHRYEPRRFAAWTTATVSVFSLIYGWYTLGLGKANNDYTSTFVIEHALEQPAFVLPEEDTFSRVDVNNGMDNLGMFWQMPTIQAFHSIVPGSVMEFYDSIGVPRSVASRPALSHYALRSLLSVRWLFEYTNEDGLEYFDEEKRFETEGVTSMPYWTYADTQNGFRIYENETYIPMGFSYDYYITRTEYETLSDGWRELVLLKALVIEDEDEEAISQLLASIDLSKTTFDRYTFAEDCAARKATAANTFARDNGGFTATLSLTEETPVFFSVPYEAGWSATVNGQPAEIFRVHGGFMAAVCPVGEDVTVRFTYETPGLRLGLWISLSGLLLLVLYLLLTALITRGKRRNDRKTPPASPLPTPDASGTTFDLYRMYEDQI